MDALRHFGAVDAPWDGSGDFPVERSVYYGGFTQGKVKPRPDSVLQRLRIDNVPPIVTTAVLLDAKDYVGKGRTLAAGTTISAEHIEGMLQAQGLAQRDLMFDAG